jgi:thiamine biosynthesis lipoprotein ApbE
VPQGLLAVDDTALGCHVRVVISGGSPADLGAAKSAVDRVLRDIDEACSRFRDDSELAHLNAAAGSEVRVSPMLGGAIEVALQAAASTEGDVDPTVGRAVRRAGYSVDFRSIPADGGPIEVAARPIPGWRCITYAPATRTVRTSPGVEIDLGATAKALAADLAAAAARGVIAAGAGVLVSLGGDIAVAGAAPDDGWTIQVSDDSSAPLDPAAERIALRSGALASSSTTVRRWVRGGVEQHHIIDPRTGAPALTPWRLASVVAGSCVDANTASTAAIIRGARAVAWLRSSGVAARLVGGTGEVERIGAWPLPQEP